MYHIFKIQKVSFAIQLLIVVALFLTGCQTPALRTISQQQLEDRYDGYVDAYKSELDLIASRSYDRIQSEYQHSLRSTEGETQSYDILVLSGGGAFGAFGIGFLDGWGKVSDPNLLRPEFDTVSGVSTGALIAPFAFIGTQDAYLEIVELYSNPEKNWVKKRGIIPYLPGNVSLYDVSSLHNKIRSTITPKLIKGMAKGAAEDRQLLVGATSVDYGMMRVWDIAQLALNTPLKNAMSQSTTLLFASAAIPGVFPPVLIDDLLYVDGGASMQFVNGIDKRNWAYTDATQPFAFVEKNRPIKIRIWIIVNQKLLSDPSVVRSRWTSIAQRSLNTLIRTSTLQAIQDIETYTSLMDQRPEIEAEMRYIAIPGDFDIPDSDEIFDKEAMRRLLQLGQEMGSNPNIWKIKALRPGAPF